MGRIQLPGLDPRLGQAIERAIRVGRKLPEFADAAALPPAANHRLEQVFVADISTVAVSTGTDWIRLDTGAAL